jgi:hypothetical protein
MKNVDPLFQLGVAAMLSRGLATELFKLKDDMEHASDMLRGLEGLVTHLEEKTA